MEGERPPDRVSRRARSWVAAAVIVGIWLLLAVLALRWLLARGGG